MNFIEQQYENAKTFYRRNLRLTFPITFFFFILVIITFSIIISMNPGLATRLLVRASDTIASGVNPAGLLPTILQNAFLGLVLLMCGIVPFLFLPLFLVLYNGGVIGILFGSTSISNVTPELIYASILPHGIFLIPAMMLSAACGVYLCINITQHLLNKKKITVFPNMLLDLVRIYVLLILPLMILSAIIQMFITPLIVQLL